MAKTSKVLAFPALTKVPAPEMPIAGAAYDKYVELATRLLHSRKLNMFTRAKCEQIAILHGQMAKRVAMNQVISATAMDSIGKLMKELQLVDESESTAPAESRSQNRFARIGVIIRPGTQKAELRSS
jgi:hypothetical protein